jgi:hypothetical protein
MAYQDTNLVHNPATGTVAPAAWGDQVRDNLEFLIDPPACSISAAGVTVASATTVVLGSTNGLENYDNDAMHNDSSNRSRITINTPGRYLALATMNTDAYQGANNAFVRFLFRLNGTTSFGGDRIKNGTPTAAEATRLGATRSFVLAATDYLEVTTDHNLGGSIQMTLDEFQVIFLTR